jgi:hypothetical protein
MLPNHHILLKRKRVRQEKLSNKKQPARIREYASVAVHKSNLIQDGLSVIRVTSPGQNMVILHIQKKSVMLVEKALQHLMKNQFVSIAIRK